MGIQWWLVLWQVSQSGETMLTSWRRWLPSHSTSTSLVWRRPLPLCQRTRTLPRVRVPSLAHPSMMMLPHWSTTRERVRCQKMDTFSCCVVSYGQSDHLSEKPGNVRGIWLLCEGNGGGLMQSQGKILLGKLSVANFKFGATWIFRTLLHIEPPLRVFFWLLNHCEYFCTEICIILTAVTVSYAHHW